MAAAFEAHGPGQGLAPTAAEAAPVILGPGDEVDPHRATQFRDHQGEAIVVQYQAGAGGGFRRPGQAVALGQGLGGGHRDHGRTQAARRPGSTAFSLS